MLKKMIILGVLGFVAVSAFGGTKFASFVRSEINSARERAESAIPPEKEITRLRGELKMLDKDILTVVNHLAKERVEVRNLEATVAEVAARQSREKELLESRAAAIKSAEGFVTFGNRKLSVDAAKAELEEGVQRYTAGQKSLESFEGLLANRTKVRDTLEKQLEELKDQKVKLATAVDTAEAELTALKLQQMQSKYQTDGTRLAKIKEDLRALNNKVAVEREKLNLMPRVHDKDQPAAAPAANKSVDDIMSPLNGKKPADTPKTGTKLPLAD